MDYFTKDNLTYHSIVLRMYFDAYDKRKNDDNDNNE